jgi:hypothetical protein
MRRDASRWSPDDDLAFSRAFAGLAA